MSETVPSIFRACWLAALGIAFIGSGVRAAETPRGSQKSTGEWSYPTDSWQSQNGLPGDTVQSFAQTADGLLWIGTSEGLFRFDGAQFTLYSHENTSAIHENSVFCLLAGRDGRLWIGTDGGGLVELRNGVLRGYGPADGITDVFIRALLEDHEGHLWVATDSGLFRLMGEKFERIDDTPVMPANAFHGLFEDHEGRVWAGAGQLYGIEHGQPIPYTLGGTDNQHRVKSILETTDGSVWVGTVAGIYRMLPGHGQFTKVPGVLGTVRTLREIEPGELWAGTIGDGIFRIRYRSSGATITRLATPSPLISNTVLSIFQDTNHSLWIGTQVGMIRLWRTPVRKVLLPTAADSDFGTVSLDSDGTLWAASNELVHIQGDRATAVQLPGVGDAHVRNVLRGRDGTLWVGTDGSGLFAISAGRTMHYTTSEGLVNNFIRALLEARDGSMWIATDSGVSHLEKHAFHNMTMSNGLSHFSIRSIIQSHDGDIWIGTELGVTHIRDAQVIHDAATETLKDMKVWAENEDSDGGLWFGTRANGLYRFRDGSITHYATANGLASDSIYSILEDGRRDLWLSGSQGVMLLDRNELDEQAKNPAKALSVHFFRADAGDRPTRFYGGTQPAGVMTRDGEAWFPTNGGLWRIIPTELDVPALSHLWINDIRVDGRSMPISSPLNLAARQSRLEISYEPVLLSSQEDLQFRYRLEGFDKEWTLARSQQRTATYTNLPPGSYTFVVEAWETDHPDQKVAASLIFIKQPFFYRTPWFIALCALGIGLLSILAYQLKMKQVHDRFQAVLAERTRLAREMHDTLIQGCASVSAMLEAAWTCDQADHESRMHLIDYANTQIRATMDEARQAVWDLRKGEQAPTDLATSIVQMSERVSREYGVHVECTLQGDPYPLGQQATHELMMVAREGVFNAVMHGHPNEVRTELHFSDKSMHMVIVDDGCGFDPTSVAENGHYGLQGIRERVHRFGGTTDIESRPDHGVRLSVAIPRGNLAL